MTSMPTMHSVPPTDPHSESLALEHCGVHLDRSQKGPPSGVCQLCQLCQRYACKYAGKAATMTGMPSMHTVPNPAWKTLAQPPPRLSNRATHPPGARRCATTPSASKGRGRGVASLPRVFSVCFPVRVPQKAFFTSPKASGNKSQPQETMRLLELFAGLGKVFRAGFPGWGVSSHFA